MSKVVFDLIDSVYLIETGTCNVNMSISYIVENISEQLVKNMKSTLDVNNIMFAHKCIAITAILCSTPVYNSCSVTLDCRQLNTVMWNNFCFVSGVRPIPSRTPKSGSLPLPTNQVKQ